MEIKKYYRATLIIDFVFVATIFIVCHFIMSAPSKWFWFGAIPIWLLIGIILRKFNFSHYKKKATALFVLVIVNIISFLVIYLFSLILSVQLYFSWKYILLFLILTALEFTLFNFYINFVRKKNAYGIEEEELNPYHSGAKIRLEDYVDKVMPRVDEVFDVIGKSELKNHMEWCEVHKDKFGDDFKVFANINILTLINPALANCNYICDITPLNNVRYVNRYFVKINELLPYGGVFISCAETSLTRKQRFYGKYFCPLNRLMYAFDFLWHRMTPKLPTIRKFYFAVTKGRHRVFPTTEILGRLYSCGFEIVKETNMHGLFFFAVMKTNRPYDDKKPSYGPFVQLKRVGKGGEFFAVYKFRTMHAYSEYLQPYIYKKNKLAEGGKFANDFRISSWGRFLRKYWIDELPMIINLLKRQMKLVGVRPLSLHYYSLYTPEMQQLRIKVKPGLLPPFYSDMPQTLEEVQESERKYIEAYMKAPFRTDWKYFWRIVKNIVFKKKRSK